MQKFGKIFMVVIAASMIYASLGSAHGVEKMVPADAKNFKVEGAEISQYIIGQKQIGDGVDGPLYQNIYSGTIGKYTIETVVSYDSADKTDVPATGSGVNGEKEWYDVDRPEFIVELPAPEGFVPALKGKKHVNLASLMKVDEVGFGTETVYEGPEHYKCRYDEDSGAQLDPNTCHEDPPVPVQVKVKVVNVDLK
jgi:hypothetical protein